MDFEHTLDRLREIDIFIRGGLFDEKTKFMIQLDEKKCIVIPDYDDKDGASNGDLQGEQDDPNSAEKGDKKKNGGSNLKKIKPFGLVNDVEMYSGKQKKWVTSAKNK